MNKSCEDLRVTLMKKCMTDTFTTLAPQIKQIHCMSSTQFEVSKCIASMNPKTKK
jgi:hypothetical protein